MKKTYIAPSERIIKVCADELLCCSNLNFSEQGTSEAGIIEMEVKGETGSKSLNLWDETW